MNKRFAVLILLLLLSISIFASDGFDLIFEETIPTDEKTTTASFDFRGKLLVGVETFVETSDVLKSEINPISDLELSIYFKSSSIDGNVDISLNPLKTDQVEYKDIIKELSLSYYIPRGKIEAGYFIHRWGVVDTARVVDILNADDLRSGLHIDPLELKISEPMILAKLFFDSTNVELLYKPIFTPLQVAMSGKWITLPDTSGYLNILPNATYTTPQITTLEYGSFGTRFAFPLGNIETALSFYHGYYERPAYLYTIVSAGPVYDVSDIETIYTKMNIVGTEVNYIKDTFTFAIEGAFYISEDTDGTNPNLYNSKFVYTGSISYLIPTSTSYITASYLGTSILRYQEGVLNDIDTMSSNQQDNTIILGIHIPLLKEKLLIESGLTYQISTQGYAILSKIDYTIDDDITLSLKGNIYGTFDENINSLYNMWSQNDSLTFSLAYQF